MCSWAPFFAGQLRTKTKTTNEYLFTIMRFEVCMLLVKQRCFFSRCCDLEKGNARSYQEESETERSPEHSCGINTGN